MNHTRFTLLETHLHAAISHFTAQNGKEGIGYFFCGQCHIEENPWDNSPLNRYFSRDFQPVIDVDSSPVHVTWKTESFIQGLRRSRENNEVIAIVHNHPSGLTSFSEQDNRNESELVALGQKRNGNHFRLLSVIILPDGRLIGRVWHSPTVFFPIELIMAIGRRYTLHYPQRDRASTAFLNRQALALGESFNQDLSLLRVGVIGCGGTGSAVSMLLPRLGLKQIALFDDDHVDETNLNRLHFSTLSDAQNSRRKVDVVRRGIEAMGLGTQVRSFPGWINSPQCRNALKACDIIFGCTDDNAGRILLNRFAYFYNTPLIDMGLAIDVGDGEPPRVRAFDGRISVIQPGSTCLLCRGIVDVQQAEAESLKRTDPNEYQRRKAEAYVVGEGNPSPAVVTFTTAVGAMAVEEMIHRMQGFRGPEGSVDQRLRRFHHLMDRRQGELPDQHCPVCGNCEYWGRGDCDPFLDANL